ncbi:MAG: BrnA antitoxin family protein, partial [Thiomargarita sp.]|nr:BrnA antitoxin family protein [Thiomargarita sp.]
MTIVLDEDLVNYFKAEAQQADTQFYQTQINQTLRRNDSGQP